MAIFIVVCFVIYVLYEVITRLTYKPPKPKDMPSKIPSHVADMIERAAERQNNRRE